tara:strand:+ start:2212 stop:2475 length:264 start_codon:yes stop_codon:yes gene_type:complete
MYMGLIDCGCGCSHNDFTEGNDYIFQKFKKLQKVKHGKNYKNFPDPEKIIDFNFKAGGKVAVMKKEKKPPKSGKIKMKTYEGDNMRN